MSHISGHSSHIQTQHNTLLFWNLNPQFFFTPRESKHSGKKNNCGSTKCKFMLFSFEANICFNYNLSSTFNVQKEEVWKCLGERAVEFLTKQTMHKERKKSVLVLISKDKGDVQSCRNHSGIKIKTFTKKNWERAVEAKLKEVMICEHGCMVSC